MIVELSTTNQLYSYLEQLVCACVNNELLTEEIIILSTLTLVMTMINS